MEDLSGVWAVYSTGILAVLAFLIALSERVQKLLGPIGRWFNTRKKRSVEQQREVESLVRESYQSQIDVLKEESSLYRQRYEALIAEVRSAVSENSELRQENAVLKKRLLEGGLYDE
ncbi:hypothetical protein [Corynebacterium accolens]|uniref:hypothetical protein n=1 Tax=Corynebacterium accolens TaxID=38284 RepID=UPI0026708F55|nr:hypothetical protein [Corynebacterium accolens]WKS54894.1 hypothetical protein NLL31_06595 [Corynebacterium accolens]